MKQPTYQDHPIASIFPLLDGAGIAALAEDIKRAGLLEPVCLYEGKVLDGRNRVRACALAGVEVRTGVFAGTALEAIRHVWSLNFARRHLNPSQAAVADARRNGMVETYAAVREAARARQVQGGREKVSQQIDEPGPRRAHGGNPGKFSGSSRFLGSAPRARG